MELSSSNMKKFPYFGKRKSPQKLLILQETLKTSYILENGTFKPKLEKIKKKSP